MPTKIRLQRYGKKGQPFYHIVIADGRAPRDGKFIEKIGTYNPITRPADIQIDFDKALYWVTTGAQPTDTVKAILHYKGVLYKKHLLKGVAKGALSQEQADVKFNEWKEAKDEKILHASKEIVLKSKTEDKKRMEAEVKVNEAKAQALAKKLAKEAKAAATAHDAAEAVEDVAEEVTEETVAEEVAEVPVADVAEEIVEPVAEVAEVVDAPVAEPADEPVAEPVAEAAAEEPGEEKPAEEEEKA
jgi:small subunit ribosomal protein S16